MTRWGGEAGVALCAPLLLALVACSSSEVSQGVGEPIRVYQDNSTASLPLAQFVEGELPGDDRGEEVETDLQILGTTEAGATDFGARGWATDVSRSVAIALEDAGSGYWVLPVGAADPAREGRLSWAAKLEFSPDIEAGEYNLQAVAIDESGRAGVRSSQPVCVRSAVPDNANACRSTIAPPFLVVSLDWDRPVDLDLRVVTPDGVVVDSKSPTTAPVDPVTGKADPSVPGTGRIDRDSNHACAIDGRQRENLVFQEKPPTGTYRVYASFFDACGEPSVTYNLSLHAQIEGDEEGTWDVVETFRRSGALRAIEADNGAKVGAYITQIRIE